MSKAIIYILVALAVIVAGAFFLGTAEVNAPVEELSEAMEGNNAASIQNISVLKFGTATLFVDVADTDNERIQGLSGRGSLPENTGLLFIFDASGKHGIWMKDMKFPIDILWLDQDFKIVHIEHSVSPDTFPTVFVSAEPALYVLEAAASFAKNNNIQIGDSAYAI